MMLAIVLPITTYAIPAPPKGDDTDIRNVFHDNFWDAMHQFGDNKSILAFGLVYLASIGAYNVFGMSVAKKMTSVHRTLIDALRTMFVWLFDVIIYYTIDKEFGEKLTYYSFLQGGGFVLLIVGTLIYNKIIRLPDRFYLREPVAVNEADRPDAVTHVLATPAADFQLGTPMQNKFGTPIDARKPRDVV